MAIVFISPQAKQKTFIRTITVGMVLVLVVVGLVFLVNLIINLKPSQGLVVSPNQPNISLNLSIIDSDKVRNLEPFVDLETEFSYVVQDKAGKKIEGNISASSKEEATVLLEQSGLTVISLEEVKAGRSQPFMAY